MKTIEKILKYTKRYLANNAKDRLALSFTKKDNQYEFKMIRPDYRFNNIDMNGNNPTLEIAMEWITEQIKSDQKPLYPLIISNDYNVINQAVRTWYRNIIKLKPTEKEYRQVHQLLFVKLKDRNLLSYLQLDEKINIEDKEKIPYLKVILESDNFEDNNGSDFTQVLTCLTKFNQLDIDIIDLFNLTLKRYKNELAKSNYQKAIFDFVRNELGSNYLKEYISYYPSQENFICPTEENKKHHLFLVEKNATAVITVDLEYIQQTYSMLNEVEISKMITQITNVIGKNKQQLNLSLITSDNLNNISIISLIGMDEIDIDQKRIKFILNTMIEMYTDMLIRKQNIDVEYLEKSFQVALMQYVVPENEFHISRPKI